MTQRQKRRTVFRVAVAVVMVAVAACSGLLLWQQIDKVREDRGASGARDDVVEVARAQVIDLTTLNSKNLEENLAALARRSTGEFKTQLDSLSSVFTSIIGQQDVVSTGEITGSGVVSISADKAEVLIAASATVTQKSPDEPKTQRYRMSVDLTKASGTWLISGMEFVP